LAQVSAAAGVSLITASRALRGLASVAPPTRERVEAAARALDYVADPAARVLAGSTSAVVGVLAPSLSNAVFTDLLRGVSEAVAPGVLVQIAVTRYDPAVEFDLLRLFRAQRPSGLIVTGLDQSPEARDLLAAMPCPVAQVMDVSRPAVDRAVGFRHREAGAAAARHLLAAGYERPVFLAAQLDPRTLQREQGYRDVAGAAAASVTSAEPSSTELGRRLLRAALERRPDLDAVFCNNDDLAVGALFEARALGIDVPGRLGICGFNDLEPAAAAEPAVTSVRTFRYEIGRRAVEALSGPPGAVHDLGFTVVARRSTDRRGAARFCERTDA
jgi:LacI family gluconate utilization system Gnt-I transcriptional repressor